VGLGRLAGAGGDGHRAQELVAAALAEGRPPSPRVPSGGTAGGGEPGPHGAGS
jgi:hypothetical protein